MKKILGACILIVALLTAPGLNQSLAQSAQDLNTTGYRLYLQGQFPEALDYFRRAVSADPDYALSRYNLACTLGVLRKAGGESVCIYDAYKSTILEHLEAAVRLDPETREKMQTDPDIDPVRDTLGYLQLLGYSPTNDEDIGAILVTISWFGPAPGAFGPTAEIDFREDGTVDLTILDASGTEVTHSRHTGTFFISAKRITFTLKQPVNGVTRFEGTILPGGSLDIPGLPGPFTDDPHECEA